MIDEPKDEVEEPNVPAMKQRVKAKPKMKPVEVVHPIEEVKQIEIEEPIVPVKKQRAKAKPKMKPVEVVQPIEEVKQIEVDQPIYKKTELVECQDCHKNMNAKTLKYNHVYICPANKFNKVNNNEVQNQRHEPIVAASSPPRMQVVEQMESLNIYPKQTARELKMIKRQESIKSLISQAI